MKKVTTNITFGQILFILLTVVFASLMFFYLGAKFGPNVLNVNNNSSAQDDSLLPDDKLAQEIKNLLVDKKQGLLFHDVLQNKVMPVNLDTKDIADDQKEMSIATQKQIQQPLVVPPVVTPIIAPVVLPVAKEVPDKTKQVVVKKIDQVPPPAVLSPDKTENQPQLDTQQPKMSYRLQLESFSEIEKVEKAKAIWQSRGFDVSVVSTEIKGKGKWYRLQVGHYDSKQAVDEAQGQIMQKYKLSSRVIEQP